MASPLLPIAMVLSALIPTLFGKRPEPVTTQETETQPPGPRSPLGPALQVPMLQMLFKNLQRYQGAGMPGGAGDILGGTGMQDIMDLLLKQWPQLMSEFSGEEQRRPRREAPTTITPGRLGG